MEWNSFHNENNITFKSEIVQMAFRYDWPVLLICKFFLMISDSNVGNTVVKIT